jgi:hypothetical protein
MTMSPSPSNKTSFELALGLPAALGAAALLASLWRGPGVRTPGPTDLD